MNLEGYLFTINKNNSFRLDPDEMKDVIQDLNLFFLGKSYNDYVTKKKIASVYYNAVKSKIEREEVVLSGGYLENYSSGCYETEVKRLSELNRLKLNETQEKIVRLLISGFSYKEIRKKLKLNNDKLTAHVKRIKQNNCQASNQLKSVRGC